MSFKRIMAALVVLGSLVAATQAAEIVLYQDSFSGNSSTLNGSSLDVTSSLYGATASATWAASSEWKVNTTAGNYAYVSSLNAVTANAWLPLVPETGLVYTLSADLYVSGYMSGEYVALGFAWEDTGLPSTSTGFYNVAKNWMVLNNYDGSGTFKVGTCMETASSWTDSDITYSTVALSESLHTFEMTLDTTGASWTATYSMDGDDYGSKSYVGPGGGGVPLSLKAVGLGYYGKYCQVDNFSLTVVPEPSSLVLLVAGLAGLLCYAWRKRR